MTTSTKNTKVIEIKNPARKRSWGWGVTEPVLKGTLSQTVNGKNYRGLANGQMFWKGSKVIRSSKDGVSFTEGFDRDIYIWEKYRTGTIKIEVLA